MKKQTVFVSSLLFSSLRISCVTALLFTLSACGSNGGGDNASGSGGGSGSVPAIKVLAANDGVNGTELWKTDGTAAGTVLVKDINTTPVADTDLSKTDSGPRNFTELNGAFYFSAYDGVNGFELWKTDGTAAGTVMVKDINPSPGAGSDPAFFTGFTEFNGALYFGADDGVHGTELWKTDGTTAGTVLVKDFTTVTGVYSSPDGFTEFNGALYFRANDGVNGSELWKTDGTTAGTKLVKDINTTIGAGSGPSDFTELNGAFYFYANDGVNGYELWKTDGSAAGTVMVKDINPTPGVGSKPYGSAVFKDALYFRADDGVRGTELWKTDGTAAGTVMVEDINVATNVPWFETSSNPYSFVEFNDALYFKADDGVHNWELWKTDGTAAGTVMVKDINPAPGVSSIPDNFIVFNGVLYFTASDSINGGNIWKTDGTAAGTVLVTATTMAYSSPNVFTELNGALYFQADDGVNGRESWKTDGTTAGTLLLKDICPGVCDGFQYY